jgi:hypothetical protein
MYFGRVSNMSISMSFNKVHLLRKLDDLHRKSDRSDENFKTIEGPYQKRKLQKKGLKMTVLFLLVADETS